jgi:hypothetical protein
VLPTAGRWPVVAADRGVAGTPGTSRSLPFGPPDVTPVPRRSLSNDQCAEEPDGSRRAASCTRGGCFTQSASPSSGHNHCNIHDRSLCRAPATRRSKTYRKFSPMTAVAVVTVSTAAFATEVSLRP